MLYVPAPVVAETWFNAKRGVIRLETTLARWWQRIMNPQLCFEPLFAEDVFTAAELNWRHQDVQDRLIVATAMRLDVPLITADAEITDWGGIPVLW